MTNLEFSRRLSCWQNPKPPITRGALGTRLGVFGAELHYRALEKPKVRRRRREKIPVSERQPLIQPGAANEVWSADLVFDRIASGRTLKCLVIVDDATLEAIAVMVEHCMGVSTSRGFWTASARGEDGPR
jgi:hypothetical protein